MAALHIDHVILELRAELRKVAELRVSIDALTSILSDTRDDNGRARMVAEDTLEVLRELRDATRALARRREPT